MIRPDRVFRQAFAIVGFAVISQLPSSLNSGQERQVNVVGIVKTSDGQPVNGRATGGSELDTIRSEFETALAKSVETALNEHEAIVNSYVELLTNSKLKLQASGNLDRVLKIKDEMEKVASSGGVTTNQDPELDGPRKIYLAAMGAADTREKLMTSGLYSSYLARLQVLETDLTKRGANEEAAAARKERERIQVESTKVPTPVSGNTADPPIVQLNPFKEATWTTPMTIPPGSYRMLKAIKIEMPKGSGSTVVAVFPKGTIVSGSNGPQLFIGKSKIIAREADFTDVKIRGDLGSRGTFEKCVLHGCTVGKGGPWGAGGNFNSKWQFDQCVIEKAFMDSFNVKRVGVNASECTFKNVVFPSIDFGGGDASTLILAEWLQVRKCRFEKCKIPLSFLLITDKCTFVDCAFVFDSPVLNLSKQVVVTGYQEKCDMRLKRTPDNVRLNLLPLREMPKQ